jgi:hypothetical protein
VHLTRGCSVFGVAVLAAACAHDSQAPSSPRPAPVVVRSVDPQQTSAPVSNPPPASAADQAVIDFCERYRLALEARDVDALMALVSPAYIDDAGTPDPADDMDYASLKADLARLLASVEKVTYEIRYRRIRREVRRITVEISYSATFVMAGKATNRVEDSELVLEPHAGTYRFLSGI